jgi:hypothetical protein
MFEHQPNGVIDIMKIEILTKSAVVEVISRIGTSAKQLQADIHQCAVSTLDHTREFGDFRGALSLVNALPNGQRVLALCEWFNHFSGGKLSFKKSAEGGFTAELAKDRVDTNFNVELAMECDFGTFTKETTPKTMTVEALIKSLESKANNDKLNTDGTPKVALEARAVAASLVASFRAQLLANLSAQTPVH